MWFSVISNKKWKPETKHYHPMAPFTWMVSISITGGSMNRSSAEWEKNTMDVFFDHCPFGFLPLPELNGPMLGLYAGVYIYLPIDRYWATIQIHQKNWQQIWTWWPCKGACNSMCTRTFVNGPPCIFFMKTVDFKKTFALAQALYEMLVIGFTCPGKGFQHSIKKIGSHWNFQKGCGILQQIGFFGWERE